jgi:putative addiction module CopG family antidote
MNVILSPQQEEVLRRKLAEGQFASAGEVIGEGLRLLDDLGASEQRRLETLRQALDRAAEQAGAGDTLPAETVFGALKARNADL